MHVLHVTRDPDVGGEQGLVVPDVESDADLTGCPDCGVVAVGHGRHVQACTTPVLRHAGASAVAQVKPPAADADCSGMAGRRRNLLLGL